MVLVAYRFYVNVLKPAAMRADFITEYLQESADGLENEDDDEWDEEEDWDEDEE